MNRRLQLLIIALPLWVGLLFTLCSSVPHGVPAVDPIYSQQSAVCHSQDNVETQCSYSDVLLSQDTVGHRGDSVIVSPRDTQQWQSLQRMSDSMVALLSPAPLNGVPETIMVRKNYVLSYNRQTLQPNWVAWCIRRGYTDGQERRTDYDFYEDMAVPAPRASIADYRRSGWSRGHLCPAADNRWDSVAMRESFALTNVCPQHKSLNSGLWNVIESDCRRWAEQYGEVYVVCGPVFLKSQTTTIGANHILVPGAFFKVILIPGENPKAFGFVVRNNEGKKNRDQYHNSIDEVERIMHMDFFPALPDEIESKVEATASMELMR